MKFHRFRLFAAALAAAALLTACFLPAVLICTEGKNCAATIVTPPKAAPAAPQPAAPASAPAAA